jgi:hypothetical protein
VNNGRVLIEAQKRRDGVHLGPDRNIALHNFTNSLNAIDLPPENSAS